MLWKCIYEYYLHIVRGTRIDQGSEEGQKLNFRQIHFYVKATKEGWRPLYQRAFKERPCPVSGICVSKTTFLFGSKLINSSRTYKLHMLNANVFLKFKLLHTSSTCDSVVAREQMRQ